MERANKVCLLSNNFALFLKHIFHNVYNYYSNLCQSAICIDRKVEKFCRTFVVGGDESKNILVSEHNGLVEFRLAKPGSLFA